MFDSPKFDPRVITTTSKNSTAGLKKIIASMYIISITVRVRLVQSNQVKATMHATVQVCGPPWRLQAAQQKANRSGKTR